MSARKRGIINEINHVSGSFALAFFIMFVLCFTFLAAADALPDIPSASEQVQNMFAEDTNAVEVTQLESPVRVKASAIGLDVAVSNPDSTDLTALDQALTNGAIRYPNSALLGNNGTVLLFGHSSSLPVIYNQNYKAFNGIQKLKEGSLISVYSDTTEYRYAVTGVRLANAEEDVIELPSSAQFLTLVTCNNSFATKTSRYVVTAEFVEAYQITN
ncbi:MAG: sortase [Patescibacteria group bacterium]